MSTRSLYLASFMTIAALLAFSVYLQVFEGVIPCPLCTMQRICFGISAALFLIGFIIYRKMMLRKFVDFLLILSSAGGLFFSSRQIWLQHFPNESANECGASLSYMIQVLHPTEVMQKVLAGSAECTTSTWQFLSLNMAEWAFICFAILFVLNIKLILKKL